MSRPTTRQKNVNQHPGLVDREGTQKRRTTEQKLADDALAEQERCNRVAARERAIDRLANVMVKSAQQEEESQSLHPKPRPRPRRVLLKVTPPASDRASQGTEGSQTLVAASLEVNSMKGLEEPDGGSLGEEDSTFFEGDDHLMGSQLPEDDHLTQDAATAAPEDNDNNDNDDTSRNLNAKLTQKPGSGAMSRQKRKPAEMVPVQNGAKEGFTGVGGVKDWAEKINSSKSFPSLLSQAQRSRSSRQTSGSQHTRSASGTTTSSHGNARGRRVTPASRRSSTRPSTPRCNTKTADSQAPVSFLEFSDQEDSLHQTDRNATLVACQAIIEVVSRSEPDEEEDLSQQLPVAGNDANSADEAADEDKALVGESDQVGPPPSKRTRTSAVQRMGSGAHNKYINMDLQLLGATTNNKWRRLFLSTLAHLISTYENPWSVPDDTFLVTLQRVWDTVYRLTVLHTVEIGGPVYYISKQALANWRVGFASAAVVAITSFFSNDPDFLDFESRAEFAMAMLENQRFLFSDNRGLDPKAWKGIWKSPFLLQTFAHHFSYAQGHVDVSDLLFKQYGPRGALALACVAAIARFLTLVMNDQVRFTPAESLDVWSSYIPKGAQYEFNEGVRGASTHYYLKPICRLSDQQFQAIMDDSQQFIKSVRALPCWAIDSENDEELSDLFAFR